MTKVWITALCTQRAWLAAFTAIHSDFRACEAPCRRLGHDMMLFDDHLGACVTTAFTSDGDTAEALTALAIRLYAEQGITARPTTPVDFATHEAVWLASAGRRVAAHALGAVAKG